MTNKNLFLNYIADKYIHAVIIATANGTPRVFYNISIPMPAEMSVNGFGSFAVNAGQLISKQNGFKSILLGPADRKQSVSIFTGNGYTKIQLTNAEIADMVKKSRSGTVPKSIFAETD